MALDDNLPNVEIESLNNLKPKFCEYVMDCDEGDCSSSCYDQNKHKCDFYRQFRRENDS